MTKNAEASNEPMMTIGLFARSCLLTVKALRNYHQQGILVPAAVDPETGYRAYHPGQLADAVAIRRLRDLDVPLSTVKQILTERDPDVTAKLLSAHEDAMRDRLAETERIVAGLQRSVDGPSPAAGVHRQTVEHQDAVAFAGRVEERDFAPFLSRAFPLVAGAIADSGLRPGGPMAALYPLEVTDEEKQRVTAFQPIDLRDGTGFGSALGGELRLIELPATTVAVAVHFGSYDTLGDAYAMLGGWVAYNARSTGEPVREIYTVSYEATSDPSEFRTDILWPIEPEPSTESHLSSAMPTTESDSL